MLNLHNKTILKSAKSVPVENSSLEILKYLFEIASRLGVIKKGMESNNSLWQGLPETPQNIAGHINETITLGMEIEKLKKELSEKYSQARELRKSKKIIINTLEKRAIGIHAHEPNILTEYGIKIKDGL